LNEGKCIFLDAAILNGAVFNIELKRKEMEDGNLNRTDIKHWFERKYRVFSQKGSFICLCCNKSVNMNLTKDEGRPFFFKHYDESECSYSENTKMYDKHVEKYENKPKKDIGLTVFREILEGQLKPYGAVIERGFHYKKRLSFIPDFIISFPSSDIIWVIDYYTAIAQGLSTGSYARHLAKRMEAYNEVGFKIFSFVDSSWLSFEEESNKGTLLSAEKVVTSKNKEDYLWDRVLNEKLNAELKKFFIEETGVSTQNFNTKNIAYVDIFNRACKLYRFIETTHNNRNMTFYRLNSSDMSLEQALTIDTNLNHFTYSNMSEEEKRDNFIKELIGRKQQFEVEHLQKEKEQARLREKEEKKQVQLKIENEKRLIQIQRAKEIEDEAIENERQEIARLAALRPIGVDPDRWEQRYSKRNLYSQYNYSNSNSNSNSKPVVQTMEDKMEIEKREKVKGKLLSQTITGEIYINGDKQYWRQVILKWINENQTGDNLYVSINVLLSFMRKNGVSFNQKDKLVQYTIKNFLELYVRIMKIEFRKKVELKITE